MGRPSDDSPDLTTAARTRSGLGTAGTRKIYSARLVTRRASLARRATRRACLAGQGRPASRTEDLLGRDKEGLQRRGAFSTASRQAPSSPSCSGRLASRWESWKPRSGRETIAARRCSRRWDRFELLSHVTLTSPSRTCVRVGSVDSDAAPLAAAESARGNERECLALRPSPLRSVVHLLDVSSIEAGGGLRRCSRRAPARRDDRGNGAPRGPPGNRQCLAIAGRRRAPDVRICGSQGTAGTGTRHCGIRLRAGPSSCRHPAERSGDLSGGPRRLYNITPPAASCTVDLRARTWAIASRRDDRHLQPRQSQPRHRRLRRGDPPVPPRRADLGAGRRTAASLRGTRAGRFRRGPVQGRTRWRGARGAGAGAGHPRARVRGGQQPGRGCVAGPGGNLVAQRRPCTRDGGRRARTPDPGSAGRLRQHGRGVPRDRADRVRCGDNPAALSTPRRGLAAAVPIFGMSHPKVGAMQAELAVALVGSGDRAGALSAALEAERIGREHLLRTLSSLPERQAITYVAARPRGLDVALSAMEGACAGSDPRRRHSGARDDPRRNGRAWPICDVHRGSAIGPRWRALANASARLAGLAVRGLGDLEPQAYQALLDSVRQQRERAEVALAEASADASTAIARREVGIVDVRAALPPRTAVVSFVVSSGQESSRRRAVSRSRDAPRTWRGHRNIWRWSCGGTARSPA